jgi:hypothetical protein
VGATGNDRFQHTYTEYHVLHFRQKKIRNNYCKKIARKQSGEGENSGYEDIGEKDCGEQDKFGADKEGVESMRYNELRIERRELKKELGEEGQ